MSEWNMWKNKFGKVYASFEEEVSRYVNFNCNFNFNIKLLSMEQWLANMAHIETHNFEYALGHKTYSLGMNHYGDLSSTEFAAQYNGFLNSKRGMHVGEDYTEHNEDDDVLQKTVDWRTEGAVSDVKDQGK